SSCLASSRGDSGSPAGAADMEPTRSGASDAGLSAAGDPGFEPAVRVANLRKRYGAHEAVAGVSFTVGRGEVFALLGPNGAGKTTTIEILEGYRGRDGGDVAVLGLDPAREAGR